ncbi:MAG: DUF697 domain-containing protein [Pseudomonadota bacterium]
MIKRLQHWIRSRFDRSSDADANSHDPVQMARESLQELLHDKRLPDAVRLGLSDDYAEVKAMLEKLEHGHLHITVFGRVSTGKSSLLNALIGKPTFYASPLHGETRHSAMETLNEARDAGVFLIDTPGIDEVFDEGREMRARELAQRSDLVLFVVDADLTSSEWAALQSVSAANRPVLLVLNKQDRYTGPELQALLEALRERCKDFLESDDIVPAMADPRPERLITKAADGTESSSERPRAPDVEAVRLRIWQVIESDGKALAAMNASLFAAHLSDKVGERVLSARSELAERLVRVYCLSKGAAVAVNPVPVADLFAAAFIDAGMVVHLSHVYGLPITRNEAGKLVAVIATHATALIGTVWAVHFVSSALKLGTGGLSTLVTAGAQGAVAYYSTYAVGQVARSYLAAGKSWGDAGPKVVIRQILNSLDRDSILKQGKRELKARFGQAQ